MRRRILAWIVAATSMAAVSARAHEIDAATVGRAGIWALGRLEASPGNPLAAGNALALDLCTPYVGTDLSAARLHLQRQVQRATLALEVAEWRTPVGTASGCGVAMRLGLGAFACGAAVHADGLQLEGLPLCVQWAPRAGIGWRHGAWSGAAVLSGNDARFGAASIDAALQCQLLPQCAAVVQNGHGAAPGDAWRLACEWRGNAWIWRAGFDLGATACSLGFAWSGSGQSFTWGAQTHPELGWSHAWTYARP
jgi:hypothetical protein